MNKETINEYINREQELLDKEYELIEQLSLIRNEKNISQRELSNYTLCNLKTL